MHVSMHVLRCGINNDKHDSLEPGSSAQTGQQCSMHKLSSGDLQ